jgi:hypothetical protein
MQTKNIIQSNVNVIRITNLKIGDLYKRYEENTYDNSVYYGIVRSINNSGEKTFIEVVEYKKTYATISADFKVFSGEKDLNIFPASISEIENEFEGITDKLEKEIGDKLKEIENKKKCIAEVQLLLSGELSKQLQTAEFKELTQSEYNLLKLKKAESLDL